MGVQGGQASAGRWSNSLPLTLAPPAPALGPCLGWAVPGVPALVLMWGPRPVPAGPRSRTAATQAAPEGHPGPDTCELIRDALEWGPPAVSSSCKWCRGLQSQGHCGRRVDRVQFAGGCASSTPWSSEQRLSLSVPRSRRGFHRAYSGCWRGPWGPHPAWECRPAWASRLFGVRHGGRGGTWQQPGLRCPQDQMPAGTCGRA